MNSGSLIFLGNLSEGTLGQRFLAKTSLERAEKRSWGTEMAQNVTPMALGVPQGQRRRFQEEADLKGATISHVH